MSHNSWCTNTDKSKSEFSAGNKPFKGNNPLRSDDAEEEFSQFDDCDSNDGFEKLNMFSCLKNGFR